MLRSIAYSLTLLVLTSAGAVGAADQAEAAPTVSCGDLPPTELQRICRSGRLVVARYYHERRPFFFKDAQDEWGGFDVDLARDVAERLGVRYESRLVGDFDELVALLDDREADVGISKLSVTLERSQRVRFTQPYMTLYQTLLMNRLSVAQDEDPFVVLDRPSARIGVVRGSSYSEHAGNAFPQAEVVPYSKFERMMFAVAGYRLDAVFVDSVGANTWRRNNPHRLIQVRTFLARNRRDPLAFAVNWQDTHLLAWLNLYLDRIRDDGSAEQMYARWFTTATEKTNEAP